MSENYSNEEWNKMVESIKEAIKDNEDSLKHLDNILNSVVELKKMEAAKPGSGIFRTWIIYLLFLFGGFDYNKPLWGIDRTEINKEDETD